ncbi:MAG: [FeFe] hydrogenase H-cluster maturation GTPase HydF [Bacteroidales bacterium]
MDTNFTHIMQTNNDNKLRIGIFGKRNQGKSSLMNVLTKQTTSIVSKQAGTTTDPVKKTIEILDLGPVVLIDTAGIDDFGVLGEVRVTKTQEILAQVDVALLLISHNEWGEEEAQWSALFKAGKIPFLILHNQSDLEPITTAFKTRIETQIQTQCIEFSTMPNSKLLNTEKIFTAIKQLIAQKQVQTVKILKGIVKENDLVLLVTPIDSQAPQGRLILPQVQLIRQCLDVHAICLVCQENEIKNSLALLKHKPVLVITDSQIFDKVHQAIPSDIALTSFSICLARQKGYFETYIQGASTLSHLKEGDRVLILESCTHQVNCEDIGRVKIPNWILKYTQKNIEFEIVSGLSPFVRPLQEYALVIQCGACMVTQKQLQNRLDAVIAAKVPLTNYGIAIAYLNGIFERATEIFRKNIK